MRVDGDSANEETPTDLDRPHIVIQELVHLPLPSIRTNATGNA